MGLFVGFSLLSLLKNSFSLQILGKKYPQRIRGLKSKNGAHL